MALFPKILSLFSFSIAYLILCLAWYDGGIETKTHIEEQTQWRRH